MQISPEIYAFPGQGNQDKIPELARYIEDDVSANIVFAEADDITLDAFGIAIGKLCLEGKDTDFEDPRILQAATLTIEVALYKALEKRGFYPKLVVGHSLGEYAALVAAKVISFEDALRLVIIRAEAMILSNEEIDGGGGMAAINKHLEPAVVDLAAKYELDIAGYNSQAQLVVSGPVDHLLALEEEVGSDDVKRLLIPYPAHSRWMWEAYEAVQDAASGMHFGRPSITFLSNWVETLRSGQQFREHLATQMIRRVNWYPQMLEAVHGRGLKSFMETGAGTALAGLHKRIFRNEVTVIPVTDLLVAT